MLDLTHLVAYAAAAGPPAAALYWAALAVLAIGAAWLIVSAVRRALRDAPIDDRLDDAETSLLDDLQSRRGDLDD
jgi:acyl-coenzyme A synthetase/AMP-(fatty) acid ligase